MKYYIGNDYPWICGECRDAIDRCAEEIAMLMGHGHESIMSGRLSLELDDKEAPQMWAYDRRLFCGGGECSCSCSIGFPLLDKTDDILCDVHGGTEEEKQAHMEKLCEENGHHFPYSREGYCWSCRKAYGRAEPIQAYTVESEV